MESILTVTSAAVSSDLTTPGAVTQQIGTTADASYAARLITQASGAVASHLGRVLARETVQQVFRLTSPRLASRQPHLLLDRAPVVSIASIVEDGTTLTTDDWEADLDAGLLYRLQSDTRADWSALKVVVTYSGGWLLPGQTGANLPSDIERATIMTVAAMAAGQGRDPALRSESVDGVGAQSWLDPRATDGALPWPAAALLAPWRRIAIA